MAKDKVKDKAKDKDKKKRKKSKGNGKDKVKALKAAAQAEVKAKAKDASKAVAKLKQVAEPIIAQGRHSLGMQPVKVVTPDDEGLAKLSSFFKIFADPTRLRILYALAEGPKCVADIAAAAGVTQGATSHQLRSMKQEKLVDFVRDGKQVIYSLADERVRALLAQGYSYINE